MKMTKIEYILYRIYVWLDNIAFKLHKILNRKIEDLQCKFYRDSLK